MHKKSLAQFKDSNGKKLQFTTIYKLIIFSKQFNGNEVDFKYVERLFTYESAFGDAGLRKCPKLTKSHISPNSFEKMLVPYATQVRIIILIQYIF
jgi:hypothetical protein